MNQWIVFGLAVAIIVLLALLVLGVVVQLGRRRKIEAAQDRANTLRQKGDHARVWPTTGP
jgi:type II secretory pathway pseudopilin PulG